MNLPVNYTRYLDVDFPREWQYVRGDVTDYETLLFGVTETYGDKFDVIPEERWSEHIEAMKENNNAWLIKHIYNQGREGSCTSNATCQCMMVAMAKQFGMERVPILSPMSLYKRCGSGPNSGSTLSCNINQAKELGVLPAAVPDNEAKYEHVFPFTGYYSRYPSGWEETASKFRIAEAVLCEGYREVISALIYGHPVLVGRQGHAICYLTPTYDSRGNLLVIYANSWGEWGFGHGPWKYGFGADSLGLIRSASQWAVAVTAVQVDEKDLLR